jgi:hypothetical protein
MFFEGTLCPLCDKEMLLKQSLFGTWGVWLPKSDALWKFCDATIHWNCYAAWEHQRQFARSYFEFWVEGRNENPYWRPAFLDDSVLVTVNPSPPVEAVWVHLAATGTRYRPALENWGNWLSDSSGDNHPLEQAALANVRQVLRTNVPTSESLLSRLTS